MTVELPFAATTPVSVGRVGLRARDANALADYYKTVVGLRELSRAGSSIVLGAGERELLEIEGSSSFKPDDPRSAGLFHTAFLLPERRNLAQWTQHAAERRIPIEGASDHLVSEALYLTDPEGNGIEIYADRPHESWAFDGSSVRMATERLNFDALMRDLGDAPWAGAPDGTVVGHVHLRVGDAGAAEQWWRDEQGFDTMAHYGDAAVFLSTGRYHHHIGANVWRSKGAGRRDLDRTGLAYVELRSKDASAGQVKSDPWGNEIRVLPAQA